MIFDDANFNFETRDRIIVIGDIHGDIKRFKNILMDAKVINNNLEWIANPQDTMVIQVGDQIDSANRTPEENNWEVLDDISVIHFTNSIDNIAKTKGGRVISLIGNHELMNAMGNFSYVSQKSHHENRIRYFMPSGSLSPILSKRPIVLKVGQLLFCHAGIKKHHLETVEKYNKDIFHVNDVWKNYILHNKILQSDSEIFNKLLVHDDGILWTRNQDDPMDLEYTLSKLGCVFVFVGHTTTYQIQLSHNKIWFTDNGISRAYGGDNDYQYIDIVNRQISVKTVKDT